MKIGIFGGTFDPWHIGHSAIINKAFEQIGLDRVIIVPTTVNYYRADKRYLFTFDEKVRIIQDFICGIDKPVEIDTVEKDKNGSWRTIDTLKYFKEKFPEDELYYLIGEDSYNDFKTWERWEDILKIVTLCVANRGNNFKIDEKVPCLKINLGNDFKDNSATIVRSILIEELIDSYLSDKEWYNKLL